MISAQVHVENQANDICQMCHKKNVAKCQSLSKYWIILNLDSLFGELIVQCRQTRPLSVLPRLWRNCTRAICIEDIPFLTKLI